MPFDFINPFMLLGLSALSLPVIVHLLSRRKYDVVAWGAMQFLELHRRERRNLRLQEILLMLLRMALIALLVTALARPWASGGPFASRVIPASRDVVLVVDGSYSMGREGGAATPHAKAIQWVHDFLEELQPGDTVTLLDARDQVRPIIGSPTEDITAVRSELDKLAPPAGTSNLAEAAKQAVRMLTRANNESREVILLTDGQALGWRPTDVQFWAGLDDLRNSASVPPQIWVVDLSEDDGAPQSDANFAVDRLHIARELVTADFPLRIQTTIHAAGAEEGVTRRVFFEVDGQPLADKTREVRLSSDGDAHVEFEYRPSTLGSHILSVVLEDDLLPGDNRADAGISVVEALPVLLVDGTPHPDPTQRETFFAQTALSAPSNSTPWIQATTVPWNSVESRHLESVSAVVLANVPRLSESLGAALADFVHRGGGLFIALGDQVDPESYNRLFDDSPPRLLAASLKTVESDTVRALGGVRIVDGSLEAPWIRRFQRARGGQLNNVRFHRWWKTTLIASDHSPADPSETGPQPRSEDSTPVLVARLDTGDPLLIEGRHGQGCVLLMTTALDADWSTFPTKSDYVPFLHELLFHSTSGQTTRNVETGMPLVLPVDREFDIDEYAFIAPDGTEHTSQRAGNELRPLVRLDETWLPGVYRFAPKADSASASSPVREAFVVNSDRTESDLTPLSPSDRLTLQKSGRMRFVRTPDDVQPASTGSTPRTELWRLLLVAFLVILVGEVFLTRRLVQGGHFSPAEDSGLAAVAVPSEQETLSNERETQGAVT